MNTARDPTPSKKMRQSQKRSERVNLLENGSFIKRRILEGVYWIQFSTIVHTTEEIAYYGNSVMENDVSNIQPEFIFAFCFWFVHFMKDSAHNVRQTL